MLRHTELNTDIVTWTRLLNRATPTVGPHTDTSASPMAIASQQETTDQKQKPNSTHHHHHNNNSESPPYSPHTSHSGESTPKSPATPNSYSRMSPSSGKDSEGGHRVNGELPPPIPISEYDLVPSSKINDHPIIPPPMEFLGSVEDLARRRASEGMLGSPVGYGGMGQAPVYLFPRDGSGGGGGAQDQHMHQNNQAPPRHQSPPRSSGGTGREVNRIHTYMHAHTLLTKKYIFKGMRSYGPEICSFKKKQSIFPLPPFPSFLFSPSFPSLPFSPTERQGLNCLLYSCPP